MQMQQTGVRVKPADLRPSLPDEAQEVILKALKFSPTDRYNDPREFGDRLARALSLAGEDVTSERKESADILPTQLPSEVTPLAQPGNVGNVGSVETIKAVFQPAAINPSAPQLGFAGRAEPSQPSKSKTGLFLGLAAVVIATLALGGWFVARQLGGEEKPPAPEVARNLSYGLTVQKMRDGRPYQDEFESSGQEIFENGWKFRMNVNSPQTGYLYLLNEGPAADGATTYNLLFPAPSTNSGSPYVAAKQEIQTGWMVFDENQGTERFWMVWAADAVPELEAVKGVVNPTDKGEISDSGQAEAVRKFLEKHSASAQQTEKDKTKKQTNVKGKGNVLVHRLDLEHH